MKISMRYELSQSELNDAVLQYITYRTQKPSTNMSVQFSNNKDEYYAYVMERTEEPQ